MLAANEANTELLSKAQKAVSGGDFDLALNLLEPLVNQPQNSQDNQDNIEALYLSAVCHRYLRDMPAAFEKLKQIQKQAPELGRAVQEEAHIYRDMGENQAALNAYQRACALNPALHASWSNQAKLHNAFGNSAAAAEAQAQATYFLALPQLLQSATHLLYEGKLSRAEKLCRAHLQEHPKDTDGIRILAEIASRFGIMEDAEFLLESAVSFAPEDDRLRLDYVDILRKRQKFSEALSESERLSERNPNNLIYISQLAVERMQTGDYTKAIELFDQILEQIPNDANTLTSRGHALKTFGLQDKAVGSYKAACVAQPSQGDAFHALANLKTYSFSDEEISTMLQQVDRHDISLQQRVNFRFALGSAYESNKLFDKAFENYALGNQLKRQQSRYDAQTMHVELAAQKIHCLAQPQSDMFVNAQSKGNQAPDPIFIVGLPRAGSTLIEQILASHSQIDGTLELPNILALSQRLRGRQRLSEGSLYPGNLSSLTDEQRVKLGQDYIDNTRVHRGSAPYFTDKMPNNFRHIGLIHMILPNAKIIDARRNPLDCCFSGFKQLFAQGQEFTYGLEEVGRYYRDYVDLMDHWDDVLPGRVLRVQHEDLLEDLDVQVRRILDHLGLPFEQGCVDFYKTQRSVRTASSEQVRRPINKDGVAKWVPFAKHLGPLADAIGFELLSHNEIEILEGTVQNER